MKLFNTVNIDCDNSENTTIYIDKCADIRKLYLFNYELRYHNKKICVITDIKSFKINQTNTDNIYVFLEIKNTPLVGNFFHS